MTSPGVPGLPRKITVTRVAAMRGRQITRQGLRSFHRAASADGADESGLTRLTYAVMANYAADAALAVALANTLFFAAATAESRSNVALYLLITVAPFALIAPVIGPLLDRVQRGRRWALAGSFAARALLAVVMALNFDTWLLYPCALGILVLSKSFGVLKAAVTPRVLPRQLSLVRTNSRLTVFGLVASLGVGALASGVTIVLGSSGGLFFTAIVLAVGVWLCMRIPGWVELTAGEVPTTLLYTQTADEPRRDRTRQPLGRTVLTGLWGNATVRLITGFLTLFVAFVVKAHTEARPLEQIAMLGLLGAGAGIGAFAGNAAGARLKLGRPDVVVLWCVGAALTVVVLAAVQPGIVTAALAALVASAGSALAKVSLDATLQRDLPEESRASAFGRSETVLQLSWVFGGAMGVLLPTTYWIGFTVLAAAAALGLVQTVVTSRGRSLLPGLGGVRPRRAPAAGRSR
ncbi:MAG: MFS transporter [Mycobacteriaceae bacterium]